MDEEEDVVEEIPGWFGKLINKWNQKTKMRSTNRSISSFEPKPKRGGFVSGEVRESDDEDEEGFSRVEEKDRKNRGVRGSLDA